MERTFLPDAALVGQELEKHVVKVDMWRVSCWTFNEYFGVKKQKLSQIANRDPNMELRILRKLSRQSVAPIGCPCVEPSRIAPIHAYSQTCGHRRRDSAACRKANGTGPRVFVLFF